LWNANDRLEFIGPPVIVHYEPGEIIPELVTANGI
jgi:hypothetical protein